ncbi:unnamed protein product [Coffea canephora]|uniref:Uncharacterized protein n=1 Tax=Coffea canephora TaxID=49390 RepID=A0A068VCA9_COFCA|nr:unnamed protein product [Coffea canephora]
MTIAATSKSFCTEAKIIEAMTTISEMVFAIERNRTSICRHLIVKRQLTDIWRLKDSFSSCFLPLFTGRNTKCWALIGQIYHKASSSCLTMKFLLYKIHVLIAIFVGLTCSLFTDENLLFDPHLPSLHLRLQKTYT